MATLISRAAPIAYLADDSGYRAFPCCYRLPDRDEYDSNQGLGQRRSQLEQCITTGYHGLFFFLKSQLILEIVVATVALSRNTPHSILLCYIEGQWHSYFQATDFDAIAMIQDNFQCCGLRSLHDRAWPFKDRDHGDNACELQLRYRRSCFLREEQQRLVSSMVIVADLMSWICMALSIWTE